VLDLDHHTDAARRRPTGAAFSSIAPTTPNEPDPKRTAAVEVSKRTAFRYYRSEEDVAPEAKLELWGDTYVAEVAAREFPGPVLTVRWVSRFLRRGVRG
jgi:hypothetical protein